MKHLISIHDLTKADILFYLDLAKELQKKPRTDMLKDKLISLAFFEPSTRTRLSFEAAALRLGAKVMGFSDTAQTSTAKGESLSDTLKIIGGYSDAIIIRHPREGAARLASEVANIPIINAGDGANQHPSQTLLDLFTLRECFGSLEGLHLAITGDLKHGRTVHSLVEAASLFDMRLYFVAAEGLALPNQLSELLKMRGLKFSFHRDIHDIIAKIDALYLTRLQKERLGTQTVHEYHGINLALLQQAKPTLKILHPLPRQEELPTEIDTTPHAAYFDQARNGVVVRQAILLKALGITL